MPASPSGGAGVFPIMIVHSVYDENPGPELCATLWLCSVCRSFVCIHSERLMATAVCPTCDGVSLQFCGTFEGILGMTAEA
jgi:hypothetical protein